jgi:hypothetical protein
MKKSRQSGRQGRFTGKGKATLNMNRADQYTVKRIDRETYELWYEDRRLATLTREEAWPVMVGQISPGAIVGNGIDDTPSGNPGKER